MNRNLTLLEPYDWKLSRIGLGGTQSAVYATEVSMQEYLAYTTEETEKMEVRELAEKLGGDMEAAIRQIAEKRKEEKQ